MRKLVGLLGGSFNPAHGGHRSISLFALDALWLDELWWLVSPGNPLKKDTAMAQLSHRFASAERQSRRSRIKISAIEKQLGTRFTIDTLRQLKRKYPKYNFIWLMGADNLAHFHHWHKWRDIAQTMPIAVIERPGYNERARFSPAMSYYRRFQKPLKQYRSYSDGRISEVPAIIFLRFRPDSRSATKVRKSNPKWFDRYQKQTIRDDLTRLIVN